MAHLPQLQFLVSTFSGVTNSWILKSNVKCCGSLVSFRKYALLRTVLSDKSVFFRSDICDKLYLSFWGFSEGALCNCDTYIIEFCTANAYNLWRNFQGTRIYRKRNNFADCLACINSIFNMSMRNEGFNNKYWSCGGPDRSNRLCA